jgi:putative membrane protein
MYYENYNFVGMRFGWWIFWGLLIFWIFATPYDIPGRRFRKNSPIQLLKKRLASGEINNEEYQKLKVLIEE